MTRAQKKMPRKIARKRSATAVADTLPTSKQNRPKHDPKKTTDREQLVKKQPAIRQKKPSIQTEPVGKEKTGKSDAKAAPSAAPDHPPHAYEYNAAQFADNMTQATKLWHQIASHIAKGLLDNQSTGGFSVGQTDPVKISEPFIKLASQIASNPYQLCQSQIGLLKDHMALWHQTTERLLGKTIAQSAQEERPDRRFKDEAWSDSTYFDFLKRSYLINSQWVKRSVENVEGLDRHTSDKVGFFTRQFLDAMSPSNFLLTNPEAIRTTLESNGDNIVKGLENMLEDVQRGHGKLRISMSDQNAFELGKNIATTPGSVVYENDLMQLIQYEPSTEKVHEVPLLITPAWINKYYVLDLRPENSFVKWAVAQGYTVFIVSWVNPDESLADKTFEDYLKEGPLTAMTVIEDITHCKKVNMIGYCLGGTLTAITAAYLRAHGMEKRLGSATYLTTMIDFSEAGELSIFIDDTQLDSLEGRMSGRGYLEADDMATTFNMLRANDLIWSFFINNYLLGKDPFPFDLLYWNSDSTRMPAKMHSYYLRNMYQKNLLVKPFGIELMDTPINVSKVQTPSYILSTKEDHIAPWMSTYAATQIYDGDITFVLAQSGHIAGVISPPSKKKYGYWVNNTLPLKADQWLAKAKFVEDSWWAHWDHWQQQHTGKKVPARKVGSKTYAPLEAAPGAYARIRV